MTTKLLYIIPLVNSNNSSQVESAMSIPGIRLSNSHSHDSQKAPLLPGEPAA